MNRIELINKKEFAKVALDKNLETFMIHIIALEAMLIHFSKIVQIAIL